MNANKKSWRRTEVVLLRLGIGKQDYRLPDGATLGDLFRAAKVDRENQEIFIDGKLAEDTVVLKARNDRLGRPPTEDSRPPGFVAGGNRDVSR